jgi:hypothetical protein
MAERDYAKGVATAKIDPVTLRKSRMCCSCKRQVWDDRTWPRRDILISESPWRSVTTEGSGPSDDCELRVNKTFSHAIPEEGGVKTYATYTDCKRIEVEGESCF